MLKKTVIAVVMVAMIATVALAANRNFGYRDIAAGTTDVTVSWVGAQATGISVYAVSADLNFTLSPLNADDTTVTVKAGTTVTMDNLQFSGFTIDRTGSTAVEVLWWGQ